MFHFFRRPKAEKQVKRLFKTEVDKETKLCFVNEVDAKTGEVLARHRTPFYDPEGKFFVDPRPMAVPVGFKKPPDLFEQIRQVVRSEHLRQAASRAGKESFEEADDFYVDDEADPFSPYEEVEDPELDGDRFPVTSTVEESRGIRAKRSKFREEYVDKSFNRRVRDKKAAGASSVVGAGDPQKSEAPTTASLMADIEALKAKLSPAK